jgi:hypothetical protein
MQLESMHSSAEIAGQAHRRVGVLYAQKEVDCAGSIRGGRKIVC